MGLLGDALPESVRKEIAESHIIIGSVLRFHVADTHPPKIKRIIVVGVDSDNVFLATIFINSEINPFKLNSEELTALQLKLASEGCPFLDHDSYADCSELYERECVSIVEVLTKDPSCHIGDISPETFTQIKQLLKSARSISVRLKKKYRLFW